VAHVGICHLEMWLTWPKCPFSLVSQVGICHLETWPTWLSWPVLGKLARGARGDSPPGPRAFLGSGTWLTWQACLLAHLGSGVNPRGRSRSGPPGSPGPRRGRRGLAHLAHLGPGGAAKVWPTWLTWAQAALPRSGPPGPPGSPGPRWCRRGLAHLAHLGAGPRRKHPALCIFSRVHRHEGNKQEMPLHATTAASERAESAGFRARARANAPARSF
jgi:hypothetical protein